MTWWLKVWADDWEEVVKNKLTTRKLELHQAKKENYDGKKEFKEMLLWEGISGNPERVRKKELDWSKGRWRDFCYT